MATLGWRLLFQCLAQLGESTTEQSGHGGRGPAGLLGDLLQRPVAQVSEDDHFPLVLGKLHEGLGQMLQLLVPRGGLTGRRVIGGEPVLQAGCRLVDVGRE